MIIDKYIQFSHSFLLSIYRLTISYNLVTQFCSVGKINAYVQTTYNKLTFSVHYCHRNIEIHIVRDLQI